MLKELTSSLSVDNLVWLSGVGVAALTTLVQKCSKKYKPWSWVFQQIGKAANKDMYDKLDILSEKIDNLEERDKCQDEERDKENALDARRRILKFADECRRHDRHSEEYFNDVLRDISYYKNYCDSHPTFQNERAVLAISTCENAYRYCMENDDFL